MRPRPPRSTRTDTLCPYTTLFRSNRCALQDCLYTFSNRRYHAIITLLSRIYLLSKNYRSEEHTSELQSLMRTSYAVFCLNQTGARTTSPCGGGRCEPGHRTDSRNLIQRPGDKQLPAVISHQ